MKSGDLFPVKRLDSTIYSHLLALRSLRTEYEVFRWKLDKAVANDDKDLIRWYVHVLSKKSRAVKILAVNRVCQINSGRHTAGVDGIAMPQR